MPFLRTQYERCTGIYPGNKERKQLKNITAYIDGSMMYGSSLSRCASLREFKDGKMKLKNSFPPKNIDGLPNDNPTGRPFDQLYVTGDVRANVQPGLMGLHSLFLREHNRLAQAFQYRNPMASDEEIFQYARHIVIAELQSVTYREYLLAILGNVLPAYNGYNDTVNSGIFNEFATAAFRAQEVDLLIVDEMRNKLFPSSAAATGTQTGFDLASINIQQGRDHGLADFNTVRKYLGLPAYKSFEEITSDRDIAEKLKSLYQSVDKFDLWVGGLAENHVLRSELGKTFLKIILEQFRRIEIDFGTKGF
nr:peroxinectin A isoform X2 [Hydra vulgaris]